MIQVKQAVIVEGKYDKIKLESFLDAVIIPTDGFRIFKDPEKCAMLRALADTVGLIVLTDSDAAGFQIRNFIRSVTRHSSNVVDIYIPQIPGKERRKSAPGKEGLLGVEGVPADEILRALETAGATARPRKQGREITYADLYELGVSGTPDSARRRRDLLQALGLPPRLSKKAMREVLNTLYTYEELAQRLSGT